MSVRECLDIIELFVKSIILFIRLIWLQSTLKKNTIFCWRLLETLSGSGLGVEDHALAVRTLSGLMGHRWTSLLGTEFSLIIT